MVLNNAFVFHLHSQTEFGLCFSMFGRIDFNAKNMPLAYEPTNSVEIILPKLRVFSLRDGTKPFPIEQYVILLTYDTKRDEKNNYNYLSDKKVLLESVCWKNHFPSSKREWSTTLTWISEKIWDSSSVEKFNRQWEKGGFSDRCFWSVGKNDSVFRNHKLKMMIVISHILLLPMIVVSVLYWHIFHIFIVVAAFGFQCFKWDLISSVYAMLRTCIIHHINLPFFNRIFFLHTFPL